MVVGGNRVPIHALHPIEAAQTRQTGHNNRFVQWERDDAGAMRDRSEGH